MYIGTQFHCRHDTDIQVLAQLGIKNVDQTPTEPWHEWTTDTLMKLRDRFDKHGISLEMIREYVKYQEKQKREYEQKSFYL